jgi:hypothetical protein
MGRRNFVQWRLALLGCLVFLLTACNALPRKPFWVTIIGPDLAVTELNTSVIEKYSSDKGEISLWVTVENLGNVAISGVDVRISVAEKVLDAPMPIYYEISADHLYGLTIPPKGTVNVSLKRVFSGHCSGGGFPGLGYILGYEAQANYTYHGFIPAGQEDVFLTNNYKEISFEGICNQLAQAKLPSPLEKKATPP